MLTKKISIIIVGRNEGWIINKCIDSVIQTINKNKLISYEIIFVDSGSTDDTLAILKNKSEVNVYSIPNGSNSAIARNVGANESCGETLLFIDGDMELCSDTFNKIYCEKKGLIYDFVSGNFENYYYKNNHVVKKNLHYSIKKDTYQNTTGGLFFIKKELWNNVGGMRNEFRRSQDIDLGLRLSNRGWPILRVKEILAIHHTTDCFDAKRIIHNAFNGNYLYKGLLYRENLFNKYIYTNYIKKEISIFVLVLSIVFAIKYANVWLLILYPFTILCKTLLQKNIKLEFSFKYVFILMIDLFTIIGVLFFWPKQKKIPYYEKKTW